MAFNESYTVMQLRAWIEDAIKKSKSPDPREKLKRERLMKLGKVSKKYAL